jgi:hypothetical protein
MAELAKIRRGIARQLPDAPHEILLTVDATSRTCARSTRTTSPARCWADLRPGYPRDAA